MSTSTVVPDDVATAPGEARGCQQLLSFGTLGTLAPGATLDWPLWLHPRASGSFAFQYVWYYEALKPVDAMKFRRAAANICPG